MKMFRTENLKKHVLNHRLDCAMALLLYNRSAQAVIEFEAVLQLSPDDPWVRWHRALALLSIGDYARGMPEHNWAWKLFDWRINVVGDTEQLMKLPPWRGGKCRPACLS